MILLQYSIISIVLILFSLLINDASSHRAVRQVTTNQCPYPDLAMCGYIQCANGRCIEDKNSADCYKCQCSPGFAGKLCDTTILTPSLCNPGCQNGGQCSQTFTNNTVCICPAEYTGAQCETSVLATHPCVINAANACRNGGTCNINGPDYICNCAFGWSGKNCETAETITSCNSNPCGVHGTCIQGALPNGPTVFCNCENQWTGKYCDINLDNPCLPGYCQSGGICQVNGGIPYCSCPSTHTGQRCETLIGALTTTTTTTSSTITPIVGSCATNPCLNGGSCFSTGNSFVCLCRQEWSGVLCNMQTPTSTIPTSTVSNSNICSPNPCLNGGACYRHSNSYVCVCTSQYTGATCELIKTSTKPPVTSPNGTITCANQPCRNGGTCYNSGSSYFCYCGLNSLNTGKNCETSITSPLSNCPLNCGSGTCINAGTSGQQLYACMCQGTLTPTACSK